MNYFHKGFQLLAIEKKAKYHPIIIFLIILLSIVCHYFFMVDGFGEPDSARLAISARMWHDSNIFSNSYTYRVSPLYLALLKVTLQLGFPANSLGDLMNWASLIIGSLTLIPMFYLFEKLINFEVALMGCLLYSFTPAFWIANIYGMPMVHAFFCFLISLLLFVHGLNRRGIWFWIMMFSSAIFSCLAVNFKADIILCFGMFLGIVLYTKDYVFRNIALSFVIPLMALISVLVLSRMLFPSLDARLANPKDWNQTFPFTLEAITNEANFSVIPKSVGKWMFLSIAVSILICLFKKEYRQQLLLVIFGAAPTFLFWGLIMGNSARHMMVAYLFLVFLLAFVLYEKTKNYKLWPTFFVGLIAINYFSCEAGGNAYRPSSRIFSVTVSIGKLVKRYEEFVLEFYNLPYRKKIFVGKGWETPYMIWEGYCIASKIEPITAERGMHLKLFDESGNFQEIKFNYINTYRDDNSFGPVPGWYLWTCNKSINVYNE